MLRQVRNVQEIRYLMTAAEVRAALEAWANDNPCANNNGYRAVVTEEAELELVDGNAIFTMRYEDKPTAEPVAGSVP